jgi:hypothetical protein
MRTSIRRMVWLSAIVSADVIFNDAYQVRFVWFSGPHALVCTHELIMFEISGGYVHIELTFVQRGMNCTVLKQHFSYNHIYNFM